MSLLAESLSAAWTAQTRAEKARTPSGKRAYVYASGWRACLRRMCLELIKPEEVDYDDNAYEAFARGDAFERDVRARLIRAGERADPPFELEGGQERLEILGKSGGVVIVGKVDGYIRWPSVSGLTPGMPRRAVLEIKGGRSVDRVETLDDFENSQWCQPYPRQLAAYMLAKGERFGVFALNRSSGPPAFVVLDLEEDRVLDMAEDFVQRAEIACEVAAGRAELPDFTDDPSLCQICPHKGRSCAPPVHFGDGLRVVRDQALVEAAKTWKEHDENRKVAERSKKALVAALRPDPPKNDQPAVSLYALGGLTLEGRWKRRGGKACGAWSLTILEGGGA